MHWGGERGDICGNVDYFEAQKTVNDIRVMCSRRGSVQP